MCYADTTKAKKVLNWEAKRGLDEMVGSAYNFVRKNNEKNRVRLTQRSDTDIFSFILSSFYPDFFYLISLQHFSPELFCGEG